MIAYKFCDLFGSRFFCALAFLSLAIIPLKAVIYDSTYLY